MKSKEGLKMIQSSAKDRVELAGMTKEIVTRSNVIKVKKKKKRKCRLEKFQVDEELESAQGVRRLTLA